MSHIHTWTSTLDPNLRQCKCGQVHRRGKNGQWAPAHRRKANRENWDWDRAEYDMLNQAHPYDTSDYRKAERDLPNYWR